MRKLLAALSAVLFGLAIPVAAHASTFTPGIYTIENASFTVGQSHYTLTGTVTFNSSGDITGSNLTFNDPTYSDPVFTGTSNNVYDGLVQAELGTTNPAGGQLTLYVDLSNSGNGLPVCYSYSVACTTQSGYGATNVQMYSPNLGPVDINSGAYLLAATPEPSSLMLLGTGVLGVAGAIRRRIRKA